MKIIRGLILLGVLFVAGCVLLGFVILIYPGVRWPSPRLYPGANAIVSEGAVGSWGLGRTQTYTIDQPADMLQAHYESEMAKYCVEDWRFAPLSSDNYVSGNWWGLDELPLYGEKGGCREASCPIYRWEMDQDFRVLICEDSEIQSTVVQVDSWQD